MFSSKKAGLLTYLVLRPSHLLNEDSGSEDAKPAAIAAIGIQ